MLSGVQILEFPQPTLTFPIGYDPKEPFKVGFMVGSDGVCYWPLFEPILFIVHYKKLVYINRALKRRGKNAMEIGPSLY